MDYRSRGDGGMEKAEGYWDGGGYWAAGPWSFFFSATRTFRCTRSTHTGIYQRSSTSSTKEF